MKYNTAGVLRSCREQINALPIDDSYSPLLHRVDSAIRYRAIHPNEPMPPVSERLTKLSHPPADLIEKSKKYLERLVEASDVKKGSYLCLHAQVEVNLADQNTQFHPKPRAVSALVKPKNRCQGLMSMHCCIKKSVLGFLPATLYLNLNRY